MSRLIISCVCLSVGSFAAIANGGDVAVVEDFNAGTADWFTGAFNTPGYQATGGADGGGYLESDSLTFDQDFVSPRPSQAPATATLFRGHDEFDASTDAFVGDWIDLGYTELSFFVRHNAPVPVQFFARLANGITNSPGASVADVQQFVPPNQWTELVLDVSRGSEDIISFGGSSATDPYAAIFSNIGNVQINAFQPFILTDEQAMSPLLFEVDLVTVSVPEPTTGFMACTALLLLGIGLRKRCVGQ